MLWFAAVHFFFSLALCACRASFVCNASLPWRPLQAKVPLRHCWRRLHQHCLADHRHNVCVAPLGRRFEPEWHKWVSYAWLSFVPFVILVCWQAPSDTGVSPSVTMWRCETQGLDSGPFRCMSKGLKLMENKDVICNVFFIVRVGHALRG